MKKQGKWFVGTTVAAGIGYAIGLLSAPRSGWRTRRKIVKSANKAKIEGERQLKKLYAELNELLEDADKKLKKAKKNANKELKSQVSSTKKTRQKIKMILSAVHNGDAQDPDLKKVVAEGKKAKANLVKFLKK